MLGTSATITRLVVSPQHFRRGHRHRTASRMGNRLPVGSVAYASTADSERAGHQRVREGRLHDDFTARSPEGVALRRLQRQKGINRIASYGIAG